MQEYQFVPDLMQTWRETNDTVKIIAIVGLYLTINMVVAILSLGAAVAALPLCRAPPAGTPARRRRAALQTPRHGVRAGRRGRTRIAAPGRGLKCGQEE